MERERWEHLKTLFDEALSLAGEARERFIRTSVSDEGLQRELRSLLDSFDSAPAFLEQPVDAETVYRIVDRQTSDAEGTRIGPYTLLHTLGVGGMGAVYLAERSDGQFERQVALKVVRPGDVRDNLPQLLFHERQILASLQHPNIARLFDGGVTDDGRPYLAMEYVVGRPIDRYCREENLPPHAVLRLFRSVCAAVQHAHQNLVIHRDLKPSNILVDDQGNVKLLDFGIAKLLGDALGASAPQTRSGARLMTLEYASPEQVRGTPVTTASDVYALGVLLYELLSGERPYTLHDMSPAQIEATICERMPPPPSTAASLTERERRRLRGDLDLIVLKALRKEPSRRYESPAHFSDDLSRYARAMPIAARPDTIRYRMTTFVRRHRSAAIASALMLTALVGGIVATTHLAREADRARDAAERRFNDVRALANTLLFDLHDAIRELPGATPARRLLVANARVYLDSLLADASNDPSLQRELAEAHQRLGEIEGDPHYPNIGDLDAATLSYRQAVALHQAIWQNDPDARDARQALAVAYGRLAVVLSWGGANAEAIAYSERALRLLASLRTRYPADLSIRHDEGRIRSELGWWLIWAGRIHEGLEALESAETDLQAVAEALPSDISAAIDLWRVYSYRADGLAWSDERDRALALLRETGCTYLQNLDRRHPDNPRILSSLRACIHKVGNLFQDGGRPEEALGAYERALALAEALAASDSTNVHGYRGVALAHESVGDLLRSLGDRAAAGRHFERALAIKQRLYRLDPSHAEAASTLANTHRSLCGLRAEEGEAGTALEHCATAIDLLERATDNDPDNAIGRENLAITFVEAARVLRAGEPTPAERTRALAHYDRALAIMGELTQSRSAFDWTVPPDTVAAERAALAETRP